MPPQDALSPDLFGPVAPPGFDYQPDLIDAAEERELAAHMAALPFEPFQFRGFEGLRRVVSFGWRYDFNRTRLEEADPIPAFLLPLRDRAAAFARHRPESLAQLLINEYRPGAPIGWHRDRPAFEDVIGVSLLADCGLRFRRRRGTGFERITVPVGARSAYLLRGAARHEWEHSIAAAEALRYSITFRTLRRG